MGEMKEKEIEPNVITYSTALNAFKEDSEEFRKIWKEMKEKQIDPNVITYNTALNACKEDSEEFRKIWKEMIEKQIEPNVITYNTALNAFKEDFEEFRKIWKEMKERQIEPDVIAHMEILDFLEKSGKFLEGKQYLQKHCADLMNISPDGKEVDCHEFSHGGSVLQIMVHLDRYPDQSSIEVITGKGLDETNPYAMMDYVTLAIKKYHPEFEIVQKQNGGRITIK